MIQFYKFLDIEKISLKIHNLPKRVIDKYTQFKDFQLLGNYIYNYIKLRISFQPLADKLQIPI